VKVPAPDSWYPAHGGSETLGTQKLGAGPEVYNNMMAPYNCVGGSEQQCIPQTCSYHCGGGPVSVPHPDTWYPAVGGESMVGTQKLGAGPEVYNCMKCPQNCVGGSETSCPAQPPVKVPAPDSWYPANGGAETLGTQKLGAGHEFYNNMDAPNNCVGGSETSCPPKHTASIPPPQTWYNAWEVGVANGASNGSGPQHQIAAPIAEANAGGQQKAVRGTPGHFLLTVHALGLAAVQGVLKGDFSNFEKDAAANASSVSELSGFVVANHICAK